MNLRVAYRFLLLAGALWPALPATRAADEAKPANPRPVAIEAAKLAEYGGVYQLDSRRRYTVVVDPNGGGLRIRLTGQPFFPYVFVGGDVFYSPAFASSFTFKRGANGVLESVTMKRDWMEMIGRRSGDAPSIVFLSAAQAQPYTGTYEWSPGAGVVITIQGEQVYAQLARQPALPVYCDRADHFVYEVIDAALSFERDAAGNLVSLTLDQGPRSTRATRLPAVPP